MPPPPEPPEERIARACLGVRVRMLSRAVTAAYDDALRPHGLRVTQLNVLVAAAKFGTARPAQVCEALLLEPSTLSRAVERMAAKGWLEVVPDATDRRAQPFRLTARGRELLAELLPAWEAAQRKLEADFGPDGVRWLDAAARRLA